MIRIIHCDECYAICLFKFCTHCGRDLDLLSWDAVELGSPGWSEREILRDGLQSDTGITRMHCDDCFSVLNLETDLFCSWCGKRVSDIAWPCVPWGSEEFYRREELRCKETQLDADET